MRRPARLISKFSIDIAERNGDAFLEVQRETLGSPEKAKATLTKWRAWFKEMAEKGELKILGEPLERAGTFVVGRKKIVTDGPFIEAAAWCAARLASIDRYVGARPALVGSERH